MNSFTSHFLLLAIFFQYMDCQSWSNILNYNTTIPSNIFPIDLLVPNMYLKILPSQTFLQNNLNITVYQLDIGSESQPIFIDPNPTPDQVQTLQYSLISNLDKYFIKVQGGSNFSLKYQLHYDLYYENTSLALKKEENGQIYPEEDILSILYFNKSQGQSKCEGRITYTGVSLTLKLFSPYSKMLATINFQQSQDQQKLVKIPSKGRWKILLIKSDENRFRPQNISISIDINQNSDEQECKQEQEQKDESNLFTIVLIIIIPAGVCLIIIIAIEIGKCCGCIQITAEERRYMDEQFNDRIGHLNETNLHPNPQSNSHFNLKVEETITFPKINLREQTLQEAAQCIICMEQTQVACTLKCGHFFHRKCINTWYIKHKNCPLCRQTIAPNSMRARS